jgi:hypothetical protein
MKRKWLLLFMGLVIIGGVLFLVVSTDPVRHSVSVTFLCYTNRDSRGMNDMYTWAWFRIENRSPYMLSCQQGALDVERAGAWLQDTNRLGFQYDPIIEPGQTLTVSMMPPADAARWRSSFLLTKMAIHSGQYWTRRYRFEAFMDSLRLDRIGLRGQPWKGKNPEPTVITSRTMDL